MKSDLDCYNGHGPGVRFYLSKATFNDLQKVFATCYQCKLISSKDWVDREMSPEEYAVYLVHHQ